MPKFTSIPNLKDLSYQSIAGEPKPISGIQELGTFTISNRGFWEDINFNETTLQPYLTDNLKTLDVLFNEEDGIPYLDSINNSPRYRYSIDAIPYVLDPNDDDEIIRLDEYYDKTNNTNEYYLATEGKVNYHIYSREIGRDPYNSSIDNYSIRPTTNNFDLYANSGDEIGHFFFKLNWGDGTSLEYTNEPKLLESTVLLDHTYEKPGFYSITGVVYAFDGNNIGAYEKFQTNILLNPSKSYEFNLYNYDNFATIGGISIDSSLVKSAVNIPGIDPIDFNDETASERVIEGIDLLDKLDLFNFLNKVDSTLLNKFEDFLLPYSQEFEIPIEMYGCMDSNANNYDGLANKDDGLCNYDFNIIINFDNSDNITSLAKRIYFDNGLSPSQLESGQQTSEGEEISGDFWYLSDIDNGDGNYNIGNTLNTSELLNDDIPKLFFQFVGQGGNETEFFFVELDNQDTLGYRFKSINVYEGGESGDLNRIYGWYTLEQINDPSMDNFELDGSRELLLEARINSDATAADIEDRQGEVVSQSGLTATEDDSFYIKTEEDGIDFTQLYTGPYHIHHDGEIHAEIDTDQMALGSVHDDEDVITTIVEANPPTNTYVVRLHNLVHTESTIEQSGQDVTIYNGPMSKVRFMGFPSNQHWLGNNMGNTGSPRNAATSTGTDKYAISIPYDGIDPEERAGLETGQAIWASNNYDGETITSSPFLEERGVRIEGKVFRPNETTSWSGWYSSPNFNNSNKITADKEYSIRLGNAELDGGIGVGVQQGNSSTYIINLYAKVTVDI